MTSLAKDNLGNTLPAFRWGRMQRLPVHAEPEASKPFATDTQVVGLLATAPFRFECGREPVAHKDCPRVLANMWIPVRVTPEHRISVVWDGAAGEIEITEMA